MNTNNSSKLTSRAGISNSHSTQGHAPGNAAPTRYLSV